MKKSKKQFKKNKSINIPENVNTVLNRPTKRKLAKDIRKDIQNTKSELNTKELVESNWRDLDGIYFTILKGLDEVLVRVKGYLTSYPGLENKLEDPDSFKAEAAELFNKVNILTNDSRKIYNETKTKREVLDPEESILMCYETFDVYNTFLTIFLDIVNKKCIALIARLDEVNPETDDEDLKDILDNIAKEKEDAKKEVNDNV